nr:MAG TPA: hypothetical protein [Caudoviricetes sp.]
MCHIQCKNKHRRRASTFNYCELASLTLYRKKITLGVNSSQPVNLFTNYANALQ